MKISHLKAPQPIPVREAFAIFVLSLVATALLFYLRYHTRLPYADEFLYLGYAYNLHTHGVFGNFIDLNTVAKADMFIPPLYPTFLSALMSLDTAFTSTTTCLLGNLVTSQGALHATGCPAEFGIAKPVQIFIAAAGYFCVWATARRLSNSMTIAVTAFALTFFARSYAFYANHFLTEALSLTLSAALGWALVSAWQHRSFKAAVLAAIAYGLLVQTRAGWEYAMLVIIPVFVWMGASGWRRDRVRAFIPLTAFLLVIAAMLTPWISRNVLTFQTPVLTSGYGPSTLLHRLPYNRMTNDEFKAAFLYWLPDFGDKLAADLLPKSHYSRLDFSSPDGIYTGERVRFEKEANNQRGTQTLFDYLLEHEIIGNLPQHTKITMALVWRGMFVSKYWGLVAWFFLLPLFIFALRRRWGALIVVTLPPVFMLGLNAFVSINVPRYNLSLVPVLAFSVAFVSVTVIAGLRGYYTTRKTPES